MLTFWSDQTVEGGLARFDDIRPVALGFEVEAETLGQVVLVLDDENALSGCRHACVALGSSSVNVLPRPVPSLNANAFPPCRRAANRTMKRPRPLLPRERAATEVGTR